MGEAMFSLRKQWEYLQLFICFCLIAVSFVAHPVQAQPTELVVNGGFEAPFSSAGVPNITGWTYGTDGDAGFCHLRNLPYGIGSAITVAQFSSCVHDGVTNTTFPAIHGNQMALWGLSGSTNTSAHFYQDVTIPAGVTAQFSFTYRLRYYASYDRGQTDPWSIPREVTVELRNPATSAPLTELYHLAFMPQQVDGSPWCCASNSTSNPFEPSQMRPSDPVNAGFPKIDTGWVNIGPVDISAYAGQTVRLYFYSEIFENWTGGGEMAIDNISILVDALPVPTETFTPFPTNTLEPTVTPTFTFTPEPTNTLEPTATATFTSTVVPTLTLVPSATPTFTSTVPPTLTLVPSATPTFTAEPPVTFTPSFTPTTGAPATPTQTFTPGGPTSVPVVNTSVPSGGGGHHVMMPTSLPVPLCSDISGVTNSIVRATLPPGVYGVHCRVIAENTEFTRSAAEVGVQSVLDRGVVQAVDIFSPSGASAAGSTVCLLGTSGSLVFLDAAQAPRVPQDLPSFDNNGYRCTMVPATGTLALVRR